MEFGVVIHLIFGTFMISNDNIFVYESKMLKVFPAYAKIAGEFMSQWLEVDSDRFYSSHSSLYCFGSLVILALFFIDKITSAMTWSGIGFISRLTTSCFSFLKVDSKTRAFSTDILSDIDPENLEQEYANTKLLMGEKRV
jgi:hypothetical protein